MKKTNTKRALGVSLISLLACGIMFAGSTYAWFTDSVEVKGNKIETGTLKVDLEMLEDGKFVSLRNATAPVFGGVLWEPGYTDFAVLKVENEGNLATKWNLSAVKVGADAKGLANVIDVYALVSDTELAAPKSIKEAGYEKVGTLAKVLADGTLLEGTFDANKTGAAKYLGIMLHMQEEAGNEYQGATDVEFDIKLNAYQLAQEVDGFGNPNYDLLWDGKIDTEWYDTTANEFVIDTPSEFAGFASLVNGTNGVSDTFAGKTITLNSDLDLNGVAWESIGDPMADGYVGFEGTFDGQGHTISNLSINESSSWGQGLFGYITSSKAVIKNFTIENVFINAEDTSGAVTGYSTYGTYENIHVTGDVNITGAQHMGGIVGNGYYANFSNCSVIANEGSKITATSGSFVGGIVGYLGERRYVKNSEVKNLELSGYGAIGTISGIIQKNSEISGCTAENIIINKTKAVSNPSVGLAVGTWTSSADSNTIISNNTFKNITLNGQYIPAAGKTDILYGSHYENHNTELYGTFDGNVTVNIVNNLQEVTGVTGEVNMDSTLGSTATGDVNVAVAAGGNMVWTTGASHGSTPFGAEDINCVTITGAGAENSSITFVGAGVGPVRANGNGVLKVKNITVIDETVSYAENSWEFGYLEIGTENSEVIFENVVFESAIMIGGAKASFINCTFKSPVANEYGVWVDNGNVTFEGCTFVGNRGLKIHEAYGTEVASVVVNNCVFDNLLKKPGIAMGDLNTATKVVISNSQFINCQAGDQGLYIYETDTDVTTFDFTSTNNIVK